MNFGKIKRFDVSDREPRFDTAPLYQKTFKPGGENGARPEATLTDYELKKPIVDLLSFFDKVGDLNITTIEIRHGLPIEISLSLDSAKSQKRFATSRAKPVVRR